MKQIWQISIKTSIKRRRTGKILNRSNIHYSACLFFILPFPSTFPNKQFFSSNFCNSSIVGKNSTFFLCMMQDCYQRIDASLYKMKEIFIKLIKLNMYFFDQRNICANQKSARRNVNEEQNIFHYCYLRSSYCSTCQ